jgi:S1-C subfamily serine protease/rhodanese-related sulfurtransferase
MLLKARPRVAAMRGVPGRRGVLSVSFGVASWAVWLALRGLAWAGEPASITETLLKAKPAVAIVMTEVSADVRLACPGGPPQRVAPPPLREHGTGFLVAPDGYVVTNGHVVQAYHEPNEAELRQTMLRQAVAQTCLAGGFTAEQKDRAAEELLPSVGPSASIDLRKTLTVVLASRETFTAEVKAYSPSLSERPGKRATSAGGSAAESGKDVAILKIDARNLPTIALGDSDRVRLGQAVHLLGYPGVVMYHDLLDKRSAVEASITSGRISSVRTDARGTPVIQTDAAASWGNSGGPAVNDQGEAVGILTFISLTADETQAIQGFNFLVPANIVREFARTAGAALDAPSPFNAVWHDALSRVSRGDWTGAQARLDAAARLVPNLPDVQRLQAEVQLRMLEGSGWPSPLVLGGVAVAVLSAGGAAWWGWRRVARHSAGRMAARPPGPDVSASPVVRVSASDLARALVQRTDLVLLDVRKPSGYGTSAVQAKGAIRTSPADVVETCAALAREQGLVLYCDLPDEASSVDAARRLLAAGYTRVVVLKGGFAAWEAASLPLERTPHARGLAAGPHAALPPPAESARGHIETAIDLPVGVKGDGPYFNARVMKLGLAGLSLRSPEALAAGQQLRLTIFTPGEPLELTGRVVAADAPPSAGAPCTADIAFDALSENHATALEGAILARRTDRALATGDEGDGTPTWERGSARRPA